MNRKYGLILVGLVGLLIIAGCAAPPADDPTTTTIDETPTETTTTETTTEPITTTPPSASENTTEGKILAELTESDTVFINTTMVHNRTIENDTQTIKDYQRQVSLIGYNLTENKFVEQTNGEEQFAGQTKTYQSETFYDGEAIYYRSKVNNSTPQWQSSEVDLNLTNEVTNVITRDFLAEYEPVATPNQTSAMVYQIDMLENKSHIDERLESVQITPYDQYRHNLDQYLIEIYVKENYQVQEIRVFAFGEWNSTELAEYDSTYDDPQYKNATATVGFAADYQYVAYNEPLNITVPESAK